MIDRILCVCQTKTESLKWVEHLRQQIKTCRQPSASANTSATSILGGYVGTNSSGGQGNPPPPPHVSYNHQPFELLTVWIRNSLTGGKLTREELIHMTRREYFSKSFQEMHHGLSKDIKCKMRKEKKQLNRVNNKVECQIFSGAPQINKDRDKMKYTAVPYDVTIKPLKENNCDTASIVSNIQEDSTLPFQTSISLKPNKTSNNDEDCRGTQPNSLNSMDAIGDDEDTITIFIPTKSFIDDDDKDDSGSDRENKSRTGQDTFRCKNPFESDFEDDASTLTGSNYGDENSSLYQFSDKQLGPWGKILPNQGLTNQLKSPTNSANIYSSCNIEDLYKDANKDVATRLNSLPLNLIYSKPEDPVKTFDGNNKQPMNNALNKELNEFSEEVTNDTGDDESLIYVDTTISDSSSMCVPYLPPIQLPLSDFENLSEYSKMYAGKQPKSEVDFLGKDIKGTLSRQESSNSSTKYDLNVPYRIREIRSITPDRELRIRTVASTEGSVSIDNNINLNTKQGEINDSIDDEGSIYAQLETSVAFSKMYLNPHEDSNTKVEKDTSCLFTANDCQCLPTIKPQAYTNSILSKQNYVVSDNATDILDEEPIPRTLKQNKDRKTPSLNCFPSNSNNRNSFETNSINEIQSNHDELMQKMQNLYDSQSDESIEASLAESVQRFHLTPDILRHVPNHHESQNNLDNSSQNHGMENSSSHEEMQALPLPQYNCMPVESNSSPLYYCENLWSHYNPEEPDNGYIEVSERPLYKSGQDKFSCVKCSDKNSSKDCSNNHNQMCHERTKKYKNSNVIPMSKLSCIPKKKRISKSINSCVTQDENESDDIYGFTPNWPHDWDNTRADCHFPMSSLSQDIGEDAHKNYVDKFQFESDLPNAIIDAQETGFPICNAKRVLRNMPQHNTVFVTPEASSELYLECTLSARWLYIERQPENKLHISSGGSSIVDPTLNKPYLEESTLMIQNEEMSVTAKKKSKIILSTLV